MAELFTAADVRELLREECDYEGGIHAFARLSKITPGHVSRVLRGEKEPGPKVLEWFGLEAVTMYQDQKQSSKGTEND